VVVFAGAAVDLNYYEAIFVGKHSSKLVEIKISVVISATAVNGCCCCRHQYWHLKLRNRDIPDI
jgi:hypothetical protein